VKGLPRSGRRVLVTRATHQAGRLSAELRRLGADVVEVAVLEMRPPESFAGLDAAIRGLEADGWLIFTSANAVTAMQRRAADLGVPLAGLPGVPQRIKVAAVGPATALAAEAAGFSVDFVPASYVAEALLAGLADGARDSRFLLVRAATARDVIPEGLRAVGATVEVVDAYRNVMPEDAPERLRLAVRQGLDAATFTSSSSVRHLAAAAVAAGLGWPLAGVAAVSIGPITSATLREMGGAVMRQAT
jgi:uroporphyrinogen-III synthase